MAGPQSQRSRYPLLVGFLEEEEDEDEDDHEGGTIMTGE